MEEEYETVYYVSSNFEGSENEVGSNYIVEQTIECDNNQSEANKDVCMENQDGTSDNQASTVIMMKEDGQVLLVEKDGNEANMIAGNYIEDVKCEPVDDDETLSHIENMDQDENGLPKPGDEVYVGDQIAGRICETTDSERSEEEREKNEQPFTPNDSVTIVHLKKTQQRVTAKVVRGLHEDMGSPKRKEEGPAVDRLTCRYCLKSFSRISNKQRHIRTIHKIKKDTGNHIRCIECDLSFKHVKKLREHLHAKHNLDMSEEELHFPNLDAFKKWKCEIERKNLCSYTLRHGSRKTPSGPKFFYVCHRSGRYLPKVMGERRRMLRVGGTCKLGIVCTAAIYVQECPDQVIVKYIPHHYGHGKETSFVQLSPEEQTAIQESVSNGIPFEKLLDDIRDSQSKDTFQLFLLKKRDFRWINSAFNAEEYNPGISDAESVENWVRCCCQMEDSPVLFYRQQNIGSDQEEFMLVIMTEFQKHILLSSSKDVVCVDSLYRRKGGRFYLTVMFVMDEFDNAFPVALCISNKVDKNVIEQFFSSVKESTGTLYVKYFMSDSESYFYQSWVNVMHNEPRWLWCIWYVDHKIRTQLKIFKGNVAKRAEVYKTMRMLLECQNENVFKCMFKNFIDNLHNNPLTTDLGNFIVKNYGKNTELWASCYRKEVDLSTNIHLEVMHNTFRYCCREGRKKRLDKFLLVVMKLVKCKMLDRISNMLDDDKLNLAIEAINMCHVASLDVPAENMSALSEKIWLIQTEEDERPVYVTKELDKCPEHCSLRCDECDICVHQYSCSCVHSMIDANLCMHIHAVVWKFLTPHFSPAGSPAHSIGALDDDVELDASPSNSSDLLESVLKRTHDVFRKVKANRCNLSKDSLNSIMKRLNESVDICLGKEIEEPVTEEPPAPPPPPTTTSVPGNTMYVINSYVKGSSQPFILPNQFPTLLANNNGASQYVMLLPNNGKITKV